MEKARAFPVVVYVFTGPTFYNMFLSMLRISGDILI